MRTARYLIVSAGCLAALWAIGLVLFAAQVENLSEAAIDSLEPTDAIVVLTGGSERVTAGLALLEAHKGKKLFISGVHAGLSREQLLGRQPVAPELKNCCIILGHAAGSTMGNAEETLTWMALEDYHSLRLVTANYHMPRSLMIFRAAMPEIKIVPHPVAPDNLRLESWWVHPGTASLLVTEYDKYLLAVVRLKLGLV